MKSVLKFTTCILAIAFILLPQPSLAQNPLDPAESGLLKNAAESAGYKEEGEQVTRRTFAKQVGGIVKTAMSFLGILFTVLMVYGGFLWMTSRGNEKQIEKAQKVITAAVIGLIIAVGAYSLTDFVVGSLFEATVGTT